MSENTEEKPPSPEAKRAARDKSTDKLARRGKEGIAALEGLGASELMAFTPESYADAWRLAEAVSKSGIVSDELRGNPGAVLAVMDSGRALGIGWGTAVQVAHVVRGRVGWPASVLDAVCDNDPEFEYFDVIEYDNEHAVVEAKKHRWDKPRRHSVTLEDADAMGFLDGKHSQLWKSKRPMPMLIAMARREAARLWNTKRLAGLHTPDELMFDRNQKPPEKNVTGATPVLSATAAETSTEAFTEPSTEPLAAAVGLAGHRKKAAEPATEPQETTAEEKAPGPIPWTPISSAELGKIEARMATIGLLEGEVPEKFNLHDTGGMINLDVRLLEELWQWLERQKKRKK